MKKFFLRGLLFGQKLNVVYYKHVNVAVFIPEIHSFLRISLALTDSRDKVARELFARGVKHVFQGVVLLYVVRYGVHYVRFAKPRAAVNKQRVITVRRVFRNGFSRGVKIAVGGADDERVESVFGVDGRGVYLRLNRRDALSREIILVAALDVKFDIGYARA